jgi:hypothetical protein
MLCRLDTALFILIWKYLSVMPHVKIKMSNANIHPFNARRLKAETVGVNAE